VIGNDLDASVDKRRYPLFLFIVNDLVENEKRWRRQRSAGYLASSRYFSRKWERMNKQFSSRKPSFSELQVAFRQAACNWRDRPLWRRDGRGRVHRGSDREVCIESGEERYDG
jgi:hypothetical protein